LQKIRCSAGVKKIFAVLFSGKYVANIRLPVILNPFLSKCGVCIAPEKESAISVNISSVIICSALCSLEI
jgi:hypothetical protein